MSREGHREKMRAKTGSRDKGQPEQRPGDGKEQGRLGIGQLIQIFRSQENVPDG